MMELREENRGQGAQGEGEKGWEGQPFELEGFLSAERRRVEAALEAALEELLPLFPPSTRDAVRWGVAGGGKRLRPILCAAAYHAGGGEHHAIYALAVSLELIHAYSLIHDDLPCMDDAAVRRGLPAVHRQFGEKVAAVAGALLIPAALLQAWRGARELGLPPEKARGILEELSRAAGAGGMVGGQVLDLLGEGQALSAAELEELHWRKTGALLRAALRMGGMAAGLDGPQLEALEQYGAAVGLAFQIADDVLDATSTLAALGKEPSDAALGKSTYVALWGLEEARSRARWWAREAVEALRSAGVSSPALMALAGYVVSRRS